MCYSPRNTQALLGPTPRKCTCELIAFCEIFIFPAGTEVSSYLTRRAVFLGLSKSHMRGFRKKERKKTKRGKDPLGNRYFCPLWPVSWVQSQILSPFLPSLSFFIFLLFLRTLLYCLPGRQPCDWTELLNTASLLWPSGPSLAYVRSLLPGAVWPRVSTDL